MLAGTIVYVYAGTKLGEFKVSPRVLPRLRAPGHFPLVAKKVLDAIKARKVYARWKRPARYDRNLIVIGAAPPGWLRPTSPRWSKPGSPLVEKPGWAAIASIRCVPSKALILSARLVSQIGAPGVRAQGATVDFAFADVMERVQRVIRRSSRTTPSSAMPGSRGMHGSTRGHDALDRGNRHARGTRTLTSRAIVIAAGARPFVPPMRDRNDRLRDIGQPCGKCGSSKRMVVLAGAPSVASSRSASRASARR